MQLRQPPKKEIKPINQNITFKKMQVIDQNGQNLGVLNKLDAIKLAEDTELDLILIAPENGEKPAICKIGDYGKFLYDKNLKIKLATKNKSANKVKEIKIKQQIGIHDLT
jgi:translation initiation factor IF-3